MIAVFLGRLLRIKSVVTVFGGTATCIPEIKYGALCNPVYRFLLLKAFKEADELAFESSFQSFILKGNGLKSRDQRIIPFGVDPELFSPVSQGETTLTLPIRFIQVAGLNRVKDQDTLLRAFKIISQEVTSILDIIGVDTLNGSIQKLASDLDLTGQVNFLGHVHHTDLPSYYRRADILLNTSLYEGQPVSVMEALSCGLVICGTQVGLVADLAEDCTVSVGTRDFTDLAQKTLELCSDPKRFEKLRKRGLSWALSHNIGWTIQQYDKVYQGLVSV